jgi:hypothetical protein
MPKELEFYLGDPNEEAKVPEFSEQEPENPIDLLSPGSDHHAFVLGYLNKRIKSSEESMNKFYARWQIAERKMQAYLSLPNYEQMLKDMNNKSQQPAPAIILFPYQYAVISTIVAYMLKALCGKKPVFTLGANSKEAADNQRYMETMLQYQADHTRILLKACQLALDSQLYGLGVIRCNWAVKYGTRRVIRPLSETEAMMAAASGSTEQYVKDKQIKKIFAGVELTNIDPFMFFPDPNVPMVDVSSKGEYVFWREFIGKHILIQAQREGSLKYVETVEPGQANQGDSKWANLSHRSALTGGQAHAGESERGKGQTVSNSYMVDQGSVEIIPRELGLGDSDQPEKWLFTILNRKQIVQAEPLDMDCGRHPVEVTEPYTLGYGFGQPALGDYIGPIQDIVSWFVDSHIYNVRASLNNQWLYDPSKINEADLKYPQPGKHIRLKPLAYGTDVRQVITNFPVGNATQNHMSDMAQFLRIGDMVSAVNDPMRGVAPQGGRRTATETRQVGESAFGRLAAITSIVSQQAWVRIAEQMVLLTQQMQEEEIWLQVIGQQAFQTVGPSLLMGDFTYPVHDGTLPVDRVANLDIWKEILQGLGQSPVLSQTHSLPRIFEHVCQLGGADNITSFRLVPDAMMDQIAKAGNAIPLAEAAAGVPQ